MRSGKDFFSANDADTCAYNDFALIRLDSDSYDSVEESLVYLYPLLSPGGVIIIDDGDAGFGATGVALASLFGAAPLDFFGFAVAAIADIDGNSKYMIAD